MALRYKGATAGEVYLGSQRAVQVYGGDKLLHDRTWKPFWGNPYPMDATGGQMTPGGNAEGDGYDPMYLLNGKLFLAKSDTPVLPEFSDFTDILLRANGDFYLPTAAGVFGKVAENIRSVKLDSFGALAVSNDDRLLAICSNGDTENPGYTVTDLSDKTDGTPELIYATIVRTPSSVFRVDYVNGDVCRITDHFLPERAVTEYNSFYDTVILADQYPQYARAFMLRNGVMHWYEPWNTTGSWAGGGPLHFMENGKPVKWRSVSGMAVMEKRLVENEYKASAFAISEDGRLFSVSYDGNIYQYRLPDPSVFEGSPWNEPLWDAVLATGKGSFFYGIHNGCLVYHGNYDPAVYGTQIGDKQDWRFLRSTGAYNACFAMDAERNLYYVQNTEVKYLGKEGA